MKLQIDQEAGASSVPHSAYHSTECIVANETQKSLLIQIFISIS